jgi:hypothetical protein
MEAQCDLVTGVCTLPQEKGQTQKAAPQATLSTLELFRNIKLTTLNNDEGNPVDISVLPPKPLTLLYCSAVLPTVLQV